MRTKEIDVDSLIKNIDESFKNQTKIQIVQIGANDGYDNDPIYDLVISDERINSCFIEPQKEAFSRLIKNYAIIKEQNRCLFLNYAISIKDGPIKLYKNINPSGNDKHSSLLLRNDDAGGNFNDNVYEIVDGIIFENFLNILENKTHNKSIDILIIDTEGFDCEIINQCINCECFPKIIFFEKPNISVDNDDRLKIIKNGSNYFNETKNKLQKLGYKIQNLQGNIIAVL